MKFSETKKEITKQFTERLIPLGFKKKNSYTFEKRIDEDFFCTVNTALFDYGEFPFSFSIGLKSIVLSRIVNYIYNGKIEFYEPVSSVDVYRLSQEDLHKEGKISIDEFILVDQDDIFKANTEIINYIDNDGVVKLKKISNYHDIEKIKHHSPYHPRQGDIGVILAKLVDNPHIEEIIETYGKVNAPLIHGDTQPKFNLAVDFVRNHSREEVLEIAGLDENLKPINNGNH